MKTYHGILKDIFKIIKYTPEEYVKYDWDFFYWTTSIFNKKNILDEREIIYTDEFINKLFEYYYKWKISKSSRWKSDLWAWLIKNLDNPINYIYKIIK